LGDGRRTSTPVRRPKRGPLSSVVHSGDYIVAEKVAGNPVAEILSENGMYS